MNESWKHCAKWKKKDIKIHKGNKVYDSVCEMTRIDKFLEIKSISFVAKFLVEEGMSSDCYVVFLGGGNENVLELDICVGCKTVNQGDLWITWIWNMQVHLKADFSMVYSAHNSQLVESTYV